MRQAKYSMAFTAGGLFYQESVKMAELYLDLTDWTAVQGQVVTMNLLQQRTLSSTKRVCREIIQRLRLLTDTQLALLCDGTRQEQKWLLWIAICKRYKFIADFACEVIREKVRGLNYVLSPDDYDAYFNAKAEWHDELEELSDSTKSKVKQVLFRMMHEAEILSRDNGIMISLLDERLASAVVEDNSGYLLLLPVTEAEVMEWSK